MRSTALSFLVAAPSLLHVANGLADDLFKAPDCPAYKPKKACASATHVLAQRNGGTKKKKLAVHLRL